MLKWSSIPGEMDLANSSFYGFWRPMMVSLDRIAEFQLKLSFHQIYAPSDLDLPQVDLTSFHSE